MFQTYVYIYIFSTSKRTDRCSAWFGRGHWRAPRRAPVQPLEHVWLGLQDDYAMRRFYANKGGCYRGKGELLYLLFYHLCMFIYIYIQIWYVSSFTSGMFLLYWTCRFLVFDHCISGGPIIPSWPNYPVSRHVWQDLQKLVSVSDMSIKPH